MASSNCRDTAANEGRREEPAEERVVDAAVHVDEANVGDCGDGWPDFCPVQGEMSGLARTGAMATEQIILCLLAFFVAMLAG